MKFSWPGNVRQLEQALFAAAALCEGEEITPDYFPAWFHKALALDLKQPIPSPNTSHPPDIEPVLQKDDQFSKEEQTRYLEALNGTKYQGTGRWNVSAAARILNIPRETLAYRLKKIGLTQ